MALIDAIAIDNNKDIVNLNVNSMIQEITEDLLNETMTAIIKDAATTHNDVKSPDMRQEPEGVLTNIKAENQRILLECSNCPILPQLNDDKLHILREQQTQTHQLLEDEKIRMDEVTEKHLTNNEQVHSE